MKYLILALLLSSCGDTWKDDVVIKKDPKDQPTKRKTEIDPKLIPYYELFENITGINAEHIPAEIVDLPDSVVGRCTYYIDWELIQIDTAYFEKGSDNSKEEVMLHELGHCALNRGHTKKVITDDYYGEIPGSIMYEFAIGDYQFYEKNKDYYHEELNNE